MNTFDKTDVEYKMIDNICYVNGEDIVSHIKLAVAVAVQDLKEMVDIGTLDDISYSIGASAIQGMVGVGMWIEEGVIDATAEDFRETLDNPWPEL